MNLGNVSLNQTDGLIIIAFAAIYMLEIYGVHNERNRMRIITKPLIMPLISLFYILNANELSPLVLAAFAGGWIGDVFLLSDGTKGFIAGLIFFLAGHIVYIFVFIGLIPDFESLTVENLFVLIPCAFYFIISFLVLRRNAGALFFPSLFYVIVLLSMVFTASISFQGMGHSPGFWILMTGALLFLVSDSLLGLKLFTRSVKKNSTLVMQSYMLAQALIAVALVSL